MRGTVVEVNRALLRPILFVGVEKRLMMINMLTCFPLVAMTHFKLSACLLSIVLFSVIHLIFRHINREDPHVANLLKRASRYYWQSYYPALSHAAHLPLRTVKTLS